MIINTSNVSSSRQSAGKKLQGRFSNINRKHLFTLVLAVTVVGTNYSYSISMMFLTTFILAYLTKGSRRR